MKSEKFTQKRERILNGDIIETIISLAWPIMIANLLITAYNLVDTFWLGKISKEAVAAPSLSWPVLFLLISFGFGFATAGVSLVSQHTGAGGREKANKVAGQVFFLLFGSSILIGIVGFFSAEWILTALIGAPAEIVPMATSYLKIIFSGLPFLFIFIAFNFLLRGTGDMKTPMYVLAVGVFLNMVFDPFLILGIGPFPKMSVSGAAIATITTRGISAIIGIYLMFNDKVHIHLSFSDLVPDMGWLRKIIDIGSPTAVARAGSALGFVVIMAFVSRFGTVPVSAYGIGMRVIQVINIAIWGFAGSTLTMVGQNIGAENKERAENIVYRSLLVTAILMFSIAAVIYLFRGEIFRIFIDNKSVINVGSEFLAIFVFSLPFFGFFRIFDSTFRATGHTKPALALSFTRIWALRIGISYLLAFTIAGIGWSLGTVGLWWGMAIGNIIAAGLSYLYFLSGKWKEKTIENKNT